MYDVNAVYSDEWGEILTRQLKDVKSVKQLAYI